MPDQWMHLIGTEQIERAAYVMKEAANQMSQAAQSIEFSLTQHQRFLDEWLSRLEEALNRDKAGEGK